MSQIFMISSADFTVSLPRGQWGASAPLIAPEEGALTAQGGQADDVVSGRSHDRQREVLTSASGQLRGRLRAVSRGRRHWCTYFRHGVSSRTFGYVDHFAFWRVVGWLRKRHLGLNMHTLVRRYLPGWHIHAGGIDMFRANAFPIERYRYRGTKIPTPWSSTTTPPPRPAA